MTASPATHVIFDLDGVLLDTEPIYTRATQEVVDEWDKVFDWSVKGDMIGRGQLDGARYLVEKLKLPISPEEYLERRRPIIEALFREVEPIDGADDFVHALAERGTPMAVATSGERALTNIKISRHPWFRIFETLVCGDDPGVKRAKPAPDIFLVVANKMDAEPSQCVVVEDSLAGVDAARAAGMRVVAMPDPNMDAARYTTADTVVAGYRELAPAVLAMLDA